MFKQPIISEPIQELATNLRKNSPALESFHCRLFSVDDAAHLYNAIKDNPFVTYAVIDTHPQSRFAYEINAIRNKILKVVELNSWLDKTKYQEFDFFKPAVGVERIQSEPILVNDWEIPKSGNGSE